MSYTSVPHKKIYILWGLAAGRCEYDGCNEKLYEDPLTKSIFNQAYLAHIIADKPDGPRGDPLLSERLKADLSNLMLLCDRHHRLVDKQDVGGHPVDRLTNMKIVHEERIRLLTDIKDEKRSNVVLYGANIGKHDSSLTLNCAQEGLVPFRFPAEARCIELSLKNSSSEDHTPEYWSRELENLESLFERKVSQTRAERPVKHYSIFGFAPQPLLIRLGTLFGDIFPADVYQLKKEPLPTWSWDDEDFPDLHFLVREPDRKDGAVGLKVSLSAPINDERVKKVLGDDCSIWELTTDNPHNDLIRTRKHLSTFKSVVRRLFDQIKSFHGEDVALNVFPAMPVSTAIEFGRVWNPKAHLPMILYDQNFKRGGFARAFEINDR